MQRRGITSLEVPYQSQETTYKVLQAPYPGNKKYNFPRPFQSLLNLGIAIRLLVLTSRKARLD